MNVYEIVQKRITEQLIEAIENGGVAPWRKPWVHGAPKNYVTQKEYRGINYILLRGGSYITFKQIQELRKKDKNIKLKKGSKSEIVVYWNFIKKEDEEGNEIDFPILKYYNVFSIQDVEGLSEKETEKSFEHDPIETAEALIKKYSEVVPIKIKKGSGRAFYSITYDEITMPHISQFENKEEYYSTMFHEITHSTGHQTRLKRFDENGTHSFGSASYSKEELVAEIGSNMILSKLGIEDEMQQENSKAYLLSWLSQIQKDIKFVTHAAQQAQKSCDLVFSVDERFNEKSEEVAMIS